MGRAPRKAGRVSAPARYDRVELTAPAGGWPAGTRGHLVEVYPGGRGLVEVEGAGAIADKARDTLVAVRLARLCVLAAADAAP